MVPPTWQGSEGWNTHPTYGWFESPAPEEWTPSFCLLPCVKAQTASGYPGDIPANAITWKVIIMPGANLRYFRT
jgi:hypothetical protein